MANPKVVISDTGKDFLSLGQLWMYRNNLVTADKTAIDGDLADIYTQNGEYLSTGFFSAVSHVVVRILTRNQNEIIDRSFWQQRLALAYHYRQTVESDNLTDCRLIFGEADGFPGLTVDRYNDILVVQISNAGIEKRKELLYELLEEFLRQQGQPITAIYQRNDLAIRTKEGLPLYKGFWKDFEGPTNTVINENGIQMKIDFENGQKTGYFLDQKTNRLLIRRIANGKRVLDCFTHTGGFALNAAYGKAASVTAVDLSETALTQAAENAKLNQLKVQWVCADVFDYLAQCQKGQFDLIILDPPAFTKSRQTVDHAYNGYKRLNETAMALLEKGGYLVTCSCSRYMETAAFEQMLRQAALETKVVLRQVSVTQQNADHPILWTMSETSYLKFYIFQLV